MGEKKYDRKKSFRDVKGKEGTESMVHDSNYLFYDDGCLCGELCGKCG